MAEGPSINIHCEEGLGHDSCSVCERPSDACYGCRACKLAFCSDCARMWYFKFMARDRNQTFHELSVKVGSYQYLYDTVSMGVWP